MPALCSESSHAPLVQHVLLAGFLSLKVPAAECCPWGLSIKPDPRSATYWRYPSPFRAPFSTPLNQDLRTVLSALYLGLWWCHPVPFLWHIFVAFCISAKPVCLRLPVCYWPVTSSDSFLPKFPLTLWSLLKNVSRQQLFPDLACAYFPSGWSALLKTWVGP